MKFFSSIILTLIALPIAGLSAQEKKKPKKKSSNPTSIITEKKQPLKISGELQLRHQVDSYPDSVIYRINNVIPAATPIDALLYEKTPENAANLFLAKLGTQYSFSDSSRVALRLTTGATGEVREPHQTMSGVEEADDSSSGDRYQILIDQAYFNYSGKDNGIKFWLGKFHHPFITSSVYSIQFHGDIQPEGAALQYQFINRDNFQSGIILSEYLLSWKTKSKFNTTVDIPLLGRRTIDYSIIFPGLETEITDPATGKKYIVKAQEKTQRVNVPIHAGQLFARFKNRTVGIEAALYNYNIPKSVENATSASEEVINTRASNIVGALLNFHLKTRLPMGISLEGWQNTNLPKPSSFNDDYYYDRRGAKGWLAGFYLGKPDKVLDWQFYFEVLEVGKNSLYTAINSADFSGPGKSNYKGYVSGFKLKLSSNALLHVYLFKARVLEQERKFQTINESSLANGLLPSAIHVVNYNPFDQYDVNEKPSDAQPYTRFRIDVNFKF